MLQLIGPTHLVKDGEVTVRCEDVGQDAVTESSVSNITSRTHARNICTHTHTLTSPGILLICSVFVGDQQQVEGV